MPQYLYGAAVQGIQKFIFATNKLKEITGASELVEKICTEYYKDIVKTITDEDVLLKAAGNIRILFKSKDEVEKLVLKFPKYVQQLVPGITICQAVVEVDGTPDMADLKKLEKCLTIQKNRIQRPFEIGVTAAARCYRTGNPAVAVDEDKKEKKYIDSGIITKREAAENSKTLTRKMIPLPEDMIINGEVFEFPLEVTELTSPENWLAVIHIDGNDLGNKVKELGESLQNNPKAIEIYRLFTKAVSDSTIEAAQKAFDYPIKNAKSILSGTTKGKFPFRPIILGGDDITVICRAELALGYTKTYLETFEEKTKHNLRPLANQVKELSWLIDGITSCAGIAYTKTNYPFHYSIALADELCGLAKKSSKKAKQEKGLKFIPSTLAFYKIQSSFHTSYGEIIKNELNIKKSKISLQFGPYALTKNNWGIPVLPAFMECVRQLQGQETLSIVSGLRQWLSELYVNENSAELLLERAHRIFEGKEQGAYQTLDTKLKEIDKKLSIQSPYSPSGSEYKKTPVAELLSILSLKGVY